MSFPLRQPIPTGAIPTPPGRPLHGSPDYPRGDPCIALASERMARGRTGLIGRTSRWADAAVGGPDRAVAPIRRSRARDPGAAELRPAAIRVEDAAERPLPALPGLVADGAAQAAVAAPASLEVLLVAVLPVMRSEPVDRDP